MAWNEFCVGSEELTASVWNTMEIVCSLLWCLLSLSVCARLGGVLHVSPSSSMRHPKPLVAMRIQKNLLTLKFCSMTRYEWIYSSQALSCVSLKSFFPGAFWVIDFVFQFSSRTTKLIYRDVGWIDALTSKPNCPINAARSLPIFHRAARDQSFSRMSFFKRPNRKKNATKQESVQSRVAESEIHGKSLAKISRAAS